MRVKNRLCTISIGPFLLISNKSERLRKRGGEEGVGKGRKGKNGGSFHLFVCHSHLI